MIGSAPSPTPGAAPTSGPSTAPRPLKLAMDPQMGLGEFGYGLSGAAWYPVTIIGDVFDAHVTIHTPANTEAIMTGAILKRDKSTDPGQIKAPSNSKPNPPSSASTSLTAPTPSAKNRSAPSIFIPTSAPKTPANPTPTSPS